MSIKAMTWAFELAQLPSMEKLVLLTLADDANNDGLAYRQNISVIAAKSTMSERTVRTHLRSLENRGLILTISNWYVGEDGRKHRSHNMYLLNVGARLIDFEGVLVADRAVESVAILAELSLGKTDSGAISAKFAGMNDQTKHENSSEPVDNLVSYRQTVAGIDQLTQELNYPPIVPPTAGA